jgi:hypothetical protein
MPRKSVKIQKIIKTKPVYAVLLVLSLTVVLFSVIGWPVYSALTTEKMVSPLPSHTMPYVDGAVAAEHVGNFYRQYMSVPKNSPAYPTDAEYQNRMIEGYGSKNLEFYNEYYQHGFDPITCSTVMPTSADVSLASTGPVATVNVYASYPNGSKATIVATVVLNNEGMEIDSIACPDGKGNLPYGRNE